MSDFFPRVKREIDAMQITCHRCQYVWLSTSALSHITVPCPNCGTTITVRPKRVLGPRTESPVGIYAASRIKKENPSIEAYAASLPPPEQQAYRDKVSSTGTGTAVFATGRGSRRNPSLHCKD